MRLKDGVSMAGVHWTIGYALAEVETLRGALVRELILARHFSPNPSGAYGDMVVTSARDGHHRDGSLHYTGLAADVRLHDLGEEFRAVLCDRAALVLRPLGFDVVHELPGATAATTAEHLHVEFDPKGNTWPPVIAG